MAAENSHDTPDTVTVIVPAHNEADSLTALMPSLVEFVQARGWQLIVVNDGSSDATPEVLAPYAVAPCVTILHNKVNRGYGGAVKTGMRAATTDIVVTADADGQHRFEDLDAVYETMRRTGADMVLGNRSAQRSSLYRELGKYLIRRITRVLMTLPVRDINTGMRMCRTRLAKNYLSLCPDAYAFCDVITLVFIHEKHLVVEREIAMNKRLAGDSAVTTRTAFETVMEILHIVTLFNPMRIFLPVALVCFVVGVTWGGSMLATRGDGVSVGAMLAITTGVLCFALGLIAEQLSAIRRSRRSE